MQSTRQCLCNYFSWLPQLWLPVTNLRGPRTYVCLGVRSNIAKGCADLFWLTQISNKPQDPKSHTQPNSLGLLSNHRVIDASLGAGHSGEGYRGLILNSSPAFLYECKALTLICILGCCR